MRTASRLADVIAVTGLAFEARIAAGAGVRVICAGNGGRLRRALEAQTRLFAGYLTATAAVMLAASLLACIGPARRALRINPTDALRQA